MPSPLSLNHQVDVTLRPRVPYHFDANLHKPSHFPSSDNAWEPGASWITMRWQRKRLGLRLQDMGTPQDPKVRLTVFSETGLPQRFLGTLRSEISYRFNFDQDISAFTASYESDEFLGPPLARWRGMKPVAANSLYETLMIYVVLQNTVIRRSMAMLEALFGCFGRDVRFDGRTLSTFWTPGEMHATEAELRGLKVGYRAKTIAAMTAAFQEGRLDETKLRGASKGDVEASLSDLYGVGPSSLSYLLYEDFYFLDDLRVVPPWERKIMSRLLFDKALVPESRILRFFRTRYPGYEKLAFHYLWEDLFWRHEREPIDWLAAEIRR